MGKWNSDVYIVSNSYESGRLRGTVPAEISKSEKSVMLIRISTGYKSQTNSQRSMGRYLYKTFVCYLLLIILPNHTNKIL